MAENFEAKKHAWRQVQDGIVLSFVIHPNDLPKALALAPLGTRYMVAVAQIGDDEQPVEATDSINESMRGTRNPEIAGANPAPAPTKERRPFESLPLSQQAAIRCNDKQFQEFMLRYSGPYPYRATPENAALLVRQCCGVDSRAKIIEGDKSGDCWLNLEATYQNWLTDARYAHLRRA